jgi:CRISP-associated protein Cas1
MKSLILNNECKLSLYNNNIVINNDYGEHLESLDVIDLIIINNKITLSTCLINELVDKNISIMINSDSKLPHAYILPLYGSINRFEIINKQILWNKEDKTKISLAIIKNKIENQERIIQMLFGQKNAYKEYLDNLDENNLTKNEAFVARKYFYKLFGSNFNRRNYDDIINRKLNYGYAIIAALITNEIISHGYLTELGINHKAKTNNLNLTYDIIEPFRPIIDLYVYKTKDVEFNNEYKNSLVQLVYQTVLYNGKDYSVINAIKEYVLSILNSLSNKKRIGYIEII